MTESIVELLRRGVLRATCISVLVAGLAACGGGSGPDGAALDLPSTQGAAGAVVTSAIVPLDDEQAPQVVELVKVTEQRVSRTIFEYTYRVKLKGQDLDLYQVAATLDAGGPGTVVVAGNLVIGQVPRREAVTSEGVVVFRQDRAYPFSPSSLKWSFRAYRPIPASTPVADAILVEDGSEVASGELLVFAQDTAEHRFVVEFIESLGWKVAGHSATQKAYQVRVPGAVNIDLLRLAADQLRESDLVDGVSLNNILKTTAYPVSDPIGELNLTNRYNWPFRAIDAYSAWAAVYSGVPDDSIPEIKIGVVDKWFEAGELDLDVANSEVSKVDPAIYKDFARELAHGNFVAGIIGAKADNRNTLGIAHRRASLSGYSVKAQDKDSFSAFKLFRSDYWTMLGGVEAAVKDGAKIVNMSMGEGKYTDCTVRTVVDIVLAAKGNSLFVSSAGNRADEPSGLGRYYADGSRSSPFGMAATLKRYDEGSLELIPCRKRSEAEFDEVRRHTLVVGAVSPDPAFLLTTDSLLIPAYSEVPRNPGLISPTASGPPDLSAFFPYLLAPGGSDCRSPNQPSRDELITSNALPYSRILPVNLVGHANCGTSFAAPHVAGVAALMMQANPALTASQVRDLILLSASKRCTDGYLVLNAARAVELARSPASVSIPICKPAPGVEKVSCTAPVVGQPMTCTLAGSNLPDTVSFTASNCGPSPMSVVTGGTAAERKFSCTPITEGIAVEVSYSVPGFIGQLQGVPTVVAADPPPRATGALNDTGIAVSQCVADQGRRGRVDLVSCTSAAAIAFNNLQDGMTGRDVSQNSNSDGKAGFSFSLVPNASGGTFDKLECVKDNVTGLTWEGKPDSGPRASVLLYQNMQSDAPQDAQGYAKYVNSTALCGFTDWRLPTIQELHSIVDYGSYNGNYDWFPNDNGSYGVRWSSTPSAGTSSSVPEGGAWIADFYTGYVGSDRRSNSHHVRLVRSPPPPAVVARFRLLVGGAEVLDEQTDLIWKRCLEGMIWNGVQCEGSPKNTFALSALGDAADKAPWRVPNIKELFSIVDTTEANDTFDAAIFPAGRIDVWSSTPCVTFRSMYVVKNGVSPICSEDTTARVRLVRER